MNDVRPDVKSLFLAAIDQRSPEELRCFLDRACANDSLVTSNLVKLTGQKRARERQQMLLPTRRPSRISAQEATSDAYDFPPQWSRASPRTAVLSQYLLTRRIV